MKSKSAYTQCSTELWAGFLDVVGYEISLHYRVFALLLLLPFLECIEQKVSASWEAI